MGLFKEKSTFKKFTEKITDVIKVQAPIDDEFMNELEEALIMADLDVGTAERIIADVTDISKKRYYVYQDKIKGALTEVITKMVDKGERNKLCPDNPLVILMIGINGGGKTTSIAKIAKKCKDEGRSVLLAAADTFRAAAADQLQEWADRIGVRVIRHEEGTDPSAVIYDAISSAKANNIDVLICDTAGRLQNKTNLMRELEKMDRVIEKSFPEANRETLLVVDATTGKNAISQAKEFNEIADITGIVLTKLDSTARGGITITLADEFDIPIKYIGMGEGIDDLLEFDPVEFAEGIFADE